MSTFFYMDLINSNFHRSIFIKLNNFSNFFDNIFYYIRTLGISKFLYLLKNTIKL